MKAKNGAWKILKERFGFVLLVIVASAVMLLSGCSDGSGGGGGSSESTVTRYGYKLNYNSSYHRINKYVAVDNGDNTFEVKSCSVHFFSVSNSNYKNRTGGELCDMIKTNAVEPSSTKDYTLENDVNPTITNKNSPTGNDTFHMYKGLEYTVYYYF